MRASLFIAAVLLSLCTSMTSAQDCPKDDPAGPLVESAPRTLTGTVVFHNDLRQWLSLELDKPVCGTDQIQLLQGGGSFEVDEGNSQKFEVFRGCRVTTTGPLGVGGTGYYSSAMYQNVDKIVPDTGCVRQPAFPQYPGAKPAREIRSYKVKMWFDYTQPQGPVHATIKTETGVVGPWQAYAHYYLTGGSVFYAYCADKFWMRHLTATPQAKPEMMDNYAMVDPEWAAEKHVRRIQLSYTCTK